MKSFDYYNNIGMSYPNKRDYITIYITDRGELVDCGPERNFSHMDIETAKDLNQAIQRVFDERAYKEQIAEYMNMQNKLHEEFQNDIFEEFGVENNPKRLNCFMLAWERSHSEGHEAVYDTFTDLVTLIQ